MRENSPTLLALGHPLRAFEFWKEKAQACERSWLLPLPALGGRGHARRHALQTLIVRGAHSGLWGTDLPCRGDSAAWVLPAKEEAPVD